MKTNLKVENRIILVFCIYQLNLIWTKPHAKFKLFKLEVECLWKAALTILTDVKNSLNRKEPSVAYNAEFRKAAKKIKVCTIFTKSVCIETAS